MKLWVPEIGDELVLSEDWTFKLYPETRNLSLATYFGYYLTNINNLNWVKESEFPNMRQPDYKIIYPTKKEIDAKCKTLFGFNYELEQNLYKEAANNCPEYVTYYNDLLAWNENIKKHLIKNIDVTLMAGDKLKVDRIYIRKGLSDFSSISFFLTSFKPIKYSSSIHRASTTKKIRFWAKLSDCNNINFNMP